MAIGAGLILAGVLLLYLILGIWAISQIFPRAPGISPEPGSHPRERNSKTGAGQQNFAGPTRISPESDRS